jgi:hypothetical protein
MTETEFNKLKTNKQRLISKHQIDLVKLLSTCEHWVFADKEGYTEGGYDYKSVSTYWKECTCCGMKKDFERVQGRSFN